MSETTVEKIGTSVADRSRQEAVEYRGAETRPLGGYLAAAGDVLPADRDDDAAGVRNRPPATGAVGTFRI